MIHTFIIEFRCNTLLLSILTVITTMNEVCSSFGHYSGTSGINALPVILG